MIEEFHTRFLAKAVGMHYLSTFAGFTDAPLTVAAERIERSAAKRRGVVVALVEEGYLDEPGAGTDEYRITQKAFEECGVEPYIGELNIGTRDKPLATWLSAGVMKQAILDLSEGKAVIEDCTRGRGKIVLSSADARSGEDREFEEFLFKNFGDLVAEITDMSDTFSENLRFTFSGVTADTAESYLEGLLAEQQKEIQRLKRRNDALVVLAHEIDAVGGWGEFVCRAKEIFLDQAA